MSEELANRARRKGERTMENRMLLITLALALLLTSCAQPVPPPTPTAEPMAEAGDDVFAQFERELEHLRQQLKIPGLSAAIVKDQELVWARGFGYADLENKVEATPDTPYRLASVTKPIAATLIMQLVEEGQLDLDDPVSNYGVDLESEGVVRVWHLLTHTSEGAPGTRHNYRGDLYGRLGQVIEGASGKSFADLLSEQILEPLDMTNSAPNYPECALAAFTASPETSERYRNHARVNRELARPYQLDPSYNIVGGAYPAHFNPGAGLISTVVDLAKFDIALDQNVLLRQETKAEMFKPAFSTHEDRTDLMYALGWYAQQYGRTRLVWHAGRQPPSVSSLYLKVPDENMSFIILANTTNLNTPHPFGYGDALYSTPALAFYRAFVFPQQHGKTVSHVDWAAAKRDLVNQLKQVTDEDVREVLERDLWSHRQLSASVGQIELAARLYGVHRQVHGASRASELDLYTVHGVEYHPVVQAQVELSEAELGRFLGEYVLSDSPPLEGGTLPTEVSLDISQGKLIGASPDQGCISLVPITPTRFAIPENPGLFVEFQLKGDRVERVTVEAGEIAAVYRPIQ
jgi:CubicO group peptidase (beta-lactamase class C family)